MSENPVLQIFHGSDVLATLCGESEEQGSVLTLREADRVGFELSPKALGYEYQIKIGDEAYTPTMIGRRSVEWSDRDYFDSARGPTRLSLIEKQEEGNGQWQERFSQEFWVTPTKLSDAAYGRMASDLAQISSGLLLDLLAKSSITIGNRGVAQVSAWSAQAELKLLDILLGKLGPALTLILQQPETRLQRSLELRACTGSEFLSPREIASLASRGIDLRGPHTLRPFSAHVPILTPSADTIENRAIVAFLHLIAARVGDCLDRARTELRLMVDRQRFWKSAGASDAGSDFEEPRRRRLEEAGELAEALLGRLRLAVRSFGKVAHYDLGKGIPDSPTFRNVAAYFGIWRLMRGYLQEAAVNIDSGAEERLKPTWRMYEQWVFLKIAGALHTSGLMCVNQQDFLAQLSKQRFTVDLQRGARLVFEAREGVQIAVTYEPTIYTKAIAQRANASVYLGASSKSPWSPDVLIEVLRPAGDGEPRLSYAVVVDAKYTRHPASRLEKCLKYLKIRSIETDQAIVRQIWVAAPVDHGILPDDAAIVWSDGGPLVTYGELVWGVLGLEPYAPTDSEANEADVAVEFVRGLLRHLGVAAPAELRTAA